MNLIPLRFLRRIGVPDDTAIHLAMLGSALLVIALVPALRFIPHFCIVRGLLGIPCPGCGISSGMRDIAAADFVSAWRANPASYAVMTVLGFQLLGRPVAMIWAGTSKGIGEASRYCANVATLALFAFWIFRLIMKEY